MKLVHFCIDAFSNGLIYRHIRKTYLAQDGRGSALMESM